MKPSKVKQDPKEVVPEVTTPLRARGAKKAKQDPKEVLELVVAHGSLKTPEGVKEIGESVSMTRRDFEHLDPKGETLVSKAKWEAMEKKREAEEEMAADDEPAAEEG